jgi:hypothetical protein
MIASYEGDARVKRLLQSPHGNVLYSATDVVVLHPRQRPSYLSLWASDGVQPPAYRLTG